MKLGDKQSRIYFVGVLELSFTVSYIWMSECTTVGFRQHGGHSWVRAHQGDSRSGATDRLYYDASQSRDAIWRERIDRATAMDSMVDLRGLEMARTRKNPVNPDKDFSRIISWVFLGVAALMTALALVSGISAGSAIASEESAPGRVVDFTIRKDSVGNEFYYPIVEFAAADAERQRVQTTEGSWPAAYLIGERVTVRYKPGQLQDVRIASAGSNFGPWIVTFITGLLAIAFTLATVFARWVSKQTLEEMPL